MSDIVKLYNPANAAALTAEEIAGLQTLTNQDLKELSTAYPNSMSSKAYLLILNSLSKNKRELPALSTFGNLYNLRTKNGQKGYVAIGFRGQFKPNPIAPQSKRKQEVLDLSDTELLTLPGFKTIDNETVVKVKKVKKEKVNKE